MQRANHVRLRFVDSKGNAFNGALVKPVTDNAALRTLFATTDCQGRCTFDELPQGYHKLSIRRGEVSEEVVIAVGTTLLEAEMVVSLDLEQHVPPHTLRLIQPGTVAPQWDIAAWTDGKTRTLADLRGHVVVMDFWGIWCSGCRRFIPVLKELQRKYQDKGVVFVSIHTASTDVSQVKMVQQMEAWESPSGVDSGASVAEGITAKRYGIGSYPSVIIVDAQGVVAYNNNTDKQLMAKLKDAAAVLHVPWPIDAGADAAETQARTRKVNEHLLSNEIDAVLAK
jgi:thiol-disulfide isomerase/thioredoxin